MWGKPLLKKGKGETKLFWTGRRMRDEKRIQCPGGGDCCENPYRNRARRKQKIEKPREKADQTNQQYWSYRYKTYKGKKHDFE
jgi:hypothetical protein